MKIILGVSASIAIYKSCELTRLLVKEGHEVHVIMTPTAAKWISPLVFSALSENKVYTDGSDEEEPLAHIELSRGADLYLVAPATANIIARAAIGDASGFLTTTLLGSDCEKWVAPSMNPKMYSHPAVQRNLKILEEYRYKILSPDSGAALCGDSGEGRMMAVEEIFKRVVEFHT